MNVIDRIEKETFAALRVDSPVGPLRLVACDEGLVLVQFVRDDIVEPDVARTGEAARLVRRAARQMAEYFAGRRRAFDLRLVPRGTPFQQATWQALRTIAYGTTISYAELARRIGRPTAVRAVGSANGANPLPIVVPCHRVIGADGSLTGFGGGLQVKQALLRLEARTLSGVAGRGMRQRQGELPLGG